VVHRVPRTPPSAHRARAQSAACRRVRAFRPGLRAGVPGIRAATTEPRRGLRTRRQAPAARGHGRPAAAPGRPVQIVSAQAWRTPISSRTNRRFLQGLVPLPRVVPDRGGASTVTSRPGLAAAAPRAGRPLSTDRLSPAGGGPTVPARRLAAPVSAARNSTGPARADPALAARPGAVLDSTGPSSTGREWRTTGREPIQVDRTSASTVPGQDSTGRKWVRMARKRVRMAREQASTVPVVVNMDRRVTTAPPARTPGSTVQEWPTTAPAARAPGSTAPGRAITAPAGRKPGTVRGWVNTDRARSRTGRTRAPVRTRPTATGTGEALPSAARTAASGDRASQDTVSPAPTRASMGQGGTVLSSSALSNTGLAITAKDTIAPASGDPSDLDLDLAGQVRDPATASASRAPAPGGWANRRATAPSAPTFAPLAGG
jgi:hypothetical protein